MVRRADFRCGRQRAFPLRQYAPRNAHTLFQHLEHAIQPVVHRRVAYRRRKYHPRRAASVAVVVLNRDKRHIAVLHGGFYAVNASGTVRQRLPQRRIQTQHRARQLVFTRNQLHVLPDFIYLGIAAVGDRHSVHVLFQSAAHGRFEKHKGQPVNARNKYIFGYTRKWFHALQRHVAPAVVHRAVADALPAFIQLIIRQPVICAVVNLHRIGYKCRVHNPPAAHGMHKHTILSHHVTTQFAVRDIRDQHAPAAAQRLSAQAVHIAEYLLQSVCNQLGSLSSAPAVRADHLKRRVRKRQRSQFVPEDRREIDLINAAVLTLLPRRVRSVAGIHLLLAEQTLDKFQKSGKHRHSPLLRHTGDMA